MSTNVKSEKNFSAENSSLSKNSLNNLRKSFLDFFASRGHEVVSSSALVPHEDPTLMFTNAGMVQFKNVFAGRTELKDKKGNKVVKAVSCQKCVRAGGKHNDLENVGYTARHHTFFEMLGNFSFGDYFKEGAIQNAWDFITKELGIPAEKLVVTIYYTDDEAFKLWKKVANLPDEKIIRIATNDNFWSMGDVGPCGPCSEIFYDHGAEIAGGPPGSPDEDGDRFIEIWNLVFMQFEKHADGTQTNLPAPCIDTGMGLERMAAVLQHVHDNYDVDLFAKLISASKKLTGKDSAEFMFSHRVLADHLRSSSFLMADGVLPSNEGRGYVLRRIMRRAMRHCHILSPNQTVMSRLVPYLMMEMGDAYPELKRAESLITTTLENEEIRFRETLGVGLKLLEAETQNLKAGDTLAGETVFKLYDTFGFPYDLTEDILKAKNIKVDNAGFEAAMNAQKAKARAAWAGSGVSATDEIYLSLFEKFGVTEFMGYQTLKASGNVVSIVKDGAEISSANNGDEVILIANQTSFYGESGGQAGDKGVIEFENGAKAIVSDTKKILGGLILHIAKIVDGKISVNDSANFVVDAKRRKAVMRAHSATHLLHAALYKTLGAHVTQKGSLVEDDYLRFDFSNPKGLTDAEISEIENIVNQEIMQNALSEVKILPTQQAMNEGATALFGEKYGDEVRVVSIGENFSKEFCGGTHVKSSGDIGLFKITRESAISSGVRRIEALTGFAALAKIKEVENTIAEIQRITKSSADEVLDKTEKAFKKIKEQEKEIADLKKKIALGGAGSGGANAGAGASDEAEKIGDISLIVQVLEGVDAKSLRSIIDEYKAKDANSVSVLIAINDGKSSIAVGVADGALKSADANKLVKAITEHLGGKGGGGRADFAQGGAPAASANRDEIISIVKAAL